jgi:hypothetical protein
MVLVFIQKDRKVKEQEAHAALNYSDGEVRNVTETSDVAEHILFDRDQN